MSGFWDEDKPRRRRKRLIFRVSDYLWPRSWQPFMRDMLTGAVIAVPVGLVTAVLLWLVLRQ